MPVIFKKGKKKAVFGISLKKNSLKSIIKAEFKTEIKVKKIKKKADKKRDINNDDKDITFNILSKKLRTVFYPLRKPSIILLFYNINYYIKYFVNLQNAGPSINSKFSKFEQYNYFILFINYIVTVKTFNIKIFTVKIRFNNRTAEIIFLI